MVVSLDCHDLIYPFNKTLFMLYWHLQIKFRCIIQGGGGGWPRFQTQKWLPMLPVACNLIIPNLMLMLMLTIFVLHFDHITNRPFSLLYECCRQNIQKVPLLNLYLCFLYCICTNVLCSFVSSLYTASKIILWCTNYMKW